MLELIEAGTISQDPNAANDQPALRLHRQRLQLDVPRRVVVDAGQQVTRLTRLAFECGKPDRFVFLAEKSLLEKLGQFATVAANQRFQRLSNHGIQFFIGGDDAATGIDHGHALIAGSEETLHGAEGFAHQSLGVLQSAGGLTGVLFGGGQRLVVLGIELTDLIAHFPKGLGQPVGAVVLRRQPLQQAAGGIHHRTCRVQHPASQQVSRQKHPAPQQDATHAKEPGQGLLHQLRSPHGGQKAKQQKWPQQTKTHGTHGEGSVSVLKRAPAQQRLGVSAGGPIRHRFPAGPCQHVEKPPAFPFAGSPPSPRGAESGPALG